MQEESPALNDNSLCTFPDGLAWHLPDSFLAAPLLYGDSDVIMTPAAVVPITTFSQNTAVSTWSSAPITDWPSTPTSFQKREALATLSKRCPLVNEDVILIALEELNFDVDSAADLLLGVDMDDAMSAFLFKVFPLVPRQVITE